MELDELRQQWQQLDRKLERSLSLNLRLLTETRTRRSKLRLLPLLLMQPLQFAIGVMLAAGFARFWLANLATPSLFVSGLVMHALSVALMIDAVMRILLIARINVAAPVVTIQRYLALLRRWEIYSFKCIWLAVWLAAPALLIVAVKLIAGIDLWTMAPMAVIYTGVGGAVGAALSLTFDRRARSGKGRVAAVMDNLYVGHSIAGAQAALDEINEFARE
jgi:serine/threonine-protein kinase